MSMEVQADYAVKGRDYDTEMIGPITGTLIDAARLARAEYANGFPNWELYRAACCGDVVYTPFLKTWAQAFAIAYGMTGGVRKDAYSDELCAIAGLDALSIVLYRRELQPYTVTATDLGVHESTYRRLRDSVARRMERSLQDYWGVLGACYRFTCHYERTYS